MLTCTLPDSERNRTSTSQHLRRLLTMLGLHRLALVTIVSLPVSMVRSAV